MEKSGQRRKLKYILGNWKMHKTKAEVLEFLSELGDSKSIHCVKGIAPQAIHLDAAILNLKSTGLLVGAQNCSLELSGALTGEISPKMLKINGKDIMELGKIGPGPSIGRVLEVLVADVVEDPKRNTKTYLFNKAKELLALPEHELESRSKQAADQVNRVEAAQDSTHKQKHWL